MTPFNIRVNIYRNTYEDDIYGGASYVSGTLLYQHEPARLDFQSVYSKTNDRPGIESPKSYSLLLRTNRQHRIDIQEEDIVEIEFPPYHELFNQRFVVRAIQMESLHPTDPNKLIECNLVRFDYSRTEFVKPGLT